jgi:hypothetical protein
MTTTALNESSTLDAAKLLSVDPDELRTMMRARLRR